MTRISRMGLEGALIAALAGACTRSEVPRPEGNETGLADTADTAPLHVSNVMIGRQIGPGNRITEPTFEFAPRDTVYVSVATQGTGEAGTLTAAWRSQSGEIVQKSSVPVPPPGENTGFRLAEPKGLRPGTYKVIVFLGDDSVDTKVFVVKK
jgi:hypothetical protein